MLLIFLCISLSLSQPCATNQYYDESTPKCIDCPNECSQCLSPFHCTQCTENYVLTVDYQCEEKLELQHCIQREGNICIECDETFFLNDNECQSCPIENCNFCTEKKCKKCAATYALFERQHFDEIHDLFIEYKQNLELENNPFKRTENVLHFEQFYTKIEELFLNSNEVCIDCTLKENNELCGRCPRGTFFNEEFHFCQQCRVETLTIDDETIETKCQLCTNNKDCYLCEDNFVLQTPSNPNSKCVKIEHCVDGFYSNNECELCEEGYFVELGKCKQCIENCARCIDEEECVMCKSGSTITNDKKCTKINYCVRTSDLIGCTECEYGYILVNGQCMKCHDSCLSCLERTDNCLSCSSGYYFKDVKNGVCEKIDDDTCKLKDKYGCSHCKTEIQYGTLNAGDSLKMKIDQQISDELKSSEEVKSRMFGFYLGYEFDAENEKLIYKQDCSLCHEYCVMCEHDSHWCTTCNDGYEIKQNYTATYLYNLHFNRIDLHDYVTEEEFNKTYEFDAEFMKEKAIQIMYSCQDRVETCKRATMGYCIECLDEYFLEGTQCLKCNETCGSCSNVEFCETCQLGNVTDGDVLYWRRPSVSMLSGIEKGMCVSVADSRLNEDELKHCKEGQVREDGCAECEQRYYRKDGVCLKCKEGCYTCAEKENSTETYCTGCEPDIEYLSSDGVCTECSKIEFCAVCDVTGCIECQEGYDFDKGECTKVNLTVILPSVGAGIVLILLIIIVIVFLIWRKRRKIIKEREKELKPFKVSSSVEMALLSADNDNFPLKTSTWTLDFGQSGNKVNVDQEFEQVVQIANPTKSSYFFEVLSGASHRYELTADPMRYTLKPGSGIEVKFTIKMLCTAIVKDEIGIVAMDMGEELKETAKLTILMESDISLKLDHTELKLQMPAIGEGAFGMVFVGTYRGQKVAVKKMKARTLTEEQEKEFKHEVSMLSQYRHNCVVNFVGAVYTEGEISIVTDFADYGSLSKVWSKGSQITFDLKIKFMEDACVGLAFLHDNKVIHRDVKGENVLVYSLNPHSPVCGKLTDFGTCRNLSDRSLQQKELTQGIGTPTYMSPESLSNTVYTFSSDVYSFAIVLYETFTEQQAYENDERFNQPWMIPQFVIEGKRLERPNGMDDNYWNLIEQCWHQEPEQRPTFPQIYQTLASWGNDITHTEMNSKVVSVDQ